VNRDCSATNISVFTRDHQAATLAHIVAEVKRFKERSTPALRFQLASGNAGVMAATNEAVRRGRPLGELGALRRRGAALPRHVPLGRDHALHRAPLGLVTVLCYALMAALGIGMKVNTLRSWRSAWAWASTTASTSSR
jgi:hypothetical protein